MGLLQILPRFLARIVSRRKAKTGVISAGVERRHDAKHLLARLQNDVALLLLSMGRWRGQQHGEHTYPQAETLVGGLSLSEAKGNQSQPDERDTGEMEGTASKIIATKQTSLGL